MLALLGVTASEVLPEIHVVVDWSEELKERVPVP